MAFLHNPKVLETLLKDTFFYLFSKQFFGSRKKLRNFDLTNIFTYVPSTDKYFANTVVRPVSLKFSKPGGSG